MTEVKEKKDLRGKRVLGNLAFQRMKKIWVLVNSRGANERVATTSYLAR